MLQFCPIKLPSTKPLFAQTSPSSVLYNPTTEGITHPTSSWDPKLPPTPTCSGKMSLRLPPINYQKSGTRKAAGSGHMPAGTHQSSEQEWAKEPRSNQQQSGLRLGARRGQSLTDLKIPPQPSISTFGSITESATASPNSLSLFLSSLSSPSPIASLRMPSPLARSSFPESVDRSTGGGRPACLLSAA